MCKFKLYIVGQTPKSLKALADLKTIFDEKFEGQFSLEVLNVLEKPELAEKDGVLATPTVIKVLPEPIRRIIGNFSDKEKVLRGLSLVSDQGSGPSS